MSARRAPALLVRAPCLQGMPQRSWLGHRVCQACPSALVKGSVFARRAPALLVRAPCLQGVRQRSWLGLAQLPWHPSCACLTASLPALETLHCSARLLQVLAPPASARCQGCFNALPPLHIELVLVTGSIAQSRSMAASAATPAPPGAVQRHLPCHNLCNFVLLRAGGQ